MPELTLFGQTHALQALNGQEEELNQAISLIESMAENINAPLNPTRDRYYILLLLDLAQQYNAIQKHHKNFLARRLQIEKLCDRIELSLAKSREYL
jgi:hypothetical protein